MPQPTEQREGAERPWTEGPWHVEDDHLCGCLSVFGTDRDERDWTICDMGVPVDLVCDAREDLHPRFVAQQEANARLIAAAPGLFEALEVAIDELLAFDGGAIDPTNAAGWSSPDAYAAFMQARAALNKALGK